MAANWWTSILEKPKFEKRDTSFIIYLQSRSLKPIKWASLVEFSEYVAAMVEVRLMEDSIFILGVDYGPDRNLSIFAEAADIPILNFPTKITMWTSKDHVAVRYGYRANEQYIYATKAYWNNQIKKSKEIIEGHMRGETLYWMDDAEEKARLEAAEIKFYQDLLPSYIANMEAAEI